MLSCTHRKSLTLLWSFLYFPTLLLAVVCFSLTVVPCVVLLSHCRPLRCASLSLFSSSCVLISSSCIDQQFLCIDRVLTSSSCPQAPPAPNNSPVSAGSAQHQRQQQQSANIGVKRPLGLALHIPTAGGWAATPVNPMRAPHELFCLHPMLLLVSHILLTFSLIACLFRTYCSLFTDCLPVSHILLTFH